MLPLGIKYLSAISLVTGFAVDSQILDTFLVVNKFLDVQLCIRNGRLVLMVDFRKHVTMLIRISGSFLFHECRKRKRIRECLLLDNFFCSNFNGGVKGWIKASRDFLL